MYIYECMYMYVYVCMYTYYMLCDLSNEWCFLFCLVVCTTKSMFAYSEYS